MSPVPPAPGSAQAAERLGCVRTSLELAMLLSYMLRRALADQRRRMPLDLPVDALNASGIAPENWKRFWGDE